jgi:hypothetical protein
MTRPAVLTVGFLEPLTDLDTGRDVPQELRRA